MCRTLLLICRPTLPDVAGVAKLMHTAAMLGNSAYSHHENPNMLSLLAKLPAAKVSPVACCKLEIQLWHTAQHTAQHSMHMPPTSPVTAQPTRSSAYYVLIEPNVHAVGTLAS